MKHPAKTTLFLIAFFFLTQVIGLIIIANTVQITAEGPAYPDTIAGERPDLEPKESFVSILFAIIIATILALLILHFKKLTLWKTWYLVAIIMAITISLETITQTSAALFIAIILGIYKAKNFILHNLSELLIYPGIVLLFVDALTPIWAIYLLIAIAIYDIIAVYHSKHMIKLAKQTMKNQTFTGIIIPVTKKKVAILGGGDIAFPMLFTAIVFTNLLLTNSPQTAFLKSLIISVTATIALSILFLISKEDRFYPAMPALALGSILGYLLI